MNQVSKKYGIHRSVLCRNKSKVSKNYPIRVLSTQEEEYLVNYINYCHKRNFPLTRKMVKVFVRQIMKKMGRAVENNNGPSNKWYRGFLKRHPTLSMKKPQIIDGGRHRMANQTVVNQHFQLLQDSLNEFGILDKAELIYNVDETGFGKSTVNEKVCTPKCSHSYTKMVTTSEHTTAVVCASAAGSFLPSMVIYEKSFPSGAYRRGIPESWLFGRSENGYIDSDLFIKWFKEIFIKYTNHLHKPEQKMMLIMDNHESHLSIELIDLAIQRNVELFCLPPHTTHILQPLDVGVFKPIKKNFHELALALGYTSKDLIIGKNRFAQVFSTAMDKTSPFIVKNSFKKCGIVPFNRDAIDVKKLVPPEEQFNQPSTAPSPLCETCGQFVHGHPLVLEGLVPSDLAEIFVPIIGQPKKQPQTRIITVARVITGTEWRKLLEEKENKKQKNIQKEKKSKKATGKKLPTTVEEQADEDDLPVISRPKKRKTKKDMCNQSIETCNTYSSRDHDDEDEDCYVCGVCGVRGCVSDDENGILWVGCDNQTCLKWFHRGCLNHDDIPYLDISLIDGSEWYCDFCRDEQVGTNVEQSVNEDFVCQVCMMSESDVSYEDDMIYWMCCGNCDHRFHKVCVPDRVHREYERCEAVSKSWVCGRCPEN